MNIKIETDDFRVKPGKKVSVKKLPTKIKDLYKDKKHYLKLLDDYTDEIKDLQNKMYAHDRYAILLIFQGMDAAGKDGAIKHVMSGINPAGTQVFTFKRPSSNELDHDWMWRSTKVLPERGRIGIFNRSYYEEVLVVKVHPEILTEYQRIPKEHLKDLDKVWKQRYQDILNFEDYIFRNGLRPIKFFINISKEEQKERLLSRIDNPAKNWKMELGDMKERSFWDDYMKAFEDAVNTTSTPDSPWYIIPGDDKKNARLIISQIILEHMRGLDMHYPVVTEEFREQLVQVRKVLVEG